MLNSFINFLKERQMKGVINFLDGYASPDQIETLIKLLIKKETVPQGNASPSPPPPPSDLIETVNKTSCNNRVIEGKYINASLKTFREYIRDVVMSTNGNLLYPPFIGQCVEYQCNPTFRDCFGIDQYTENKIIINKASTSNSKLVKYITAQFGGKDPNNKKDPDNKKDPLFCIFCVLNIFCTSK
jgi:hypothetical protein